MQIEAIGREGETLILPEEARDFSNTGRDSKFPEKWEAAFNEFECFREEVRNRLGVEFCVRGKIGLMNEEARNKKPEPREVRKDQQLKI